MRIHRPTRPTRWSRRGQSGMTLIETMLALSLSTLMVLPMLAWAQLAWGQQAATFDRNVTGTTLGILRTSFVADVTGADAAWVDGDELVDCGTGAGAKGQPILVLGDGDQRTVYSISPDDDGDDGLWRRTCVGPGKDVTSASLLVSGVLPKVTDVSCDESPTSVAVDAAAKAAATDGPLACGRLTLRITTDNLAQTAMTATRRAVGTLVEPPVAILVAEPTEGARPLVVKFTSEGSNDPKGGSLSYRWDFGDGSESKDREVEHEYVGVGTFEVTLTVTDDSGMSATATTKVVVADNAPAAVIAAPVNGLTTYRGEIVAFSARGSNDDLDITWGGKIVGHFWDFGDGTTSEEAEPLKAYATLSPKEGYRVTLTVTDDAGQRSTTSIDLTVANREPRVLISTTPERGTAPLIVEVAALVDDELTMAENPPLTYLWDFGDGRTSTDAAPKQIVYDRAGSWKVTLTVTDDQGAIATGSREVMTTSQIVTAPTGLTQRNSGREGPDNRFIELAWGRVEGAVGYEVSLVCQKCDERTSRAAQGTTVRVGGLQRDRTRYDASVRAQGPDGTWGPFSASVEVRS